MGRAVVEETRRVIDYHNARVYLLDPPDDLVPIAFEGRVGAYEKVDLDILRTKIGEGFTGWVALHGQPLRIDDATADARGATIPGTDDVDESMLVVPMQHDGKLVGVITLSKLGLRQFDDDDLRLLMILADQAGTAFSGAANLAETRRLAAELRQLLDMSSALSRSLDPRAVADLMAEHLARAVGADRAQISDWDRRQRPAADARLLPDAARADMDDFYPLEGYPLTCQVLQNGVIETVDTEDPTADPAEVDLLRRDGHARARHDPADRQGRGDRSHRARVDRPAQPRTPGQITLATTMAHEAAMALENARLYETARNLADRDPLTGFFNHRYLHERLAEEVVRAVRTHRPLSVVMLDLDDFKLVNDSFGHLYGDGVLVHVAELIRSSLRGSDVPARYGGDEFALILPETTCEDAAGVAARILAAFRGIAVLRRTGGCRSRSAPRSASRPTRRTDGRRPTCSRSPTPACTPQRPRAATGSGLRARRPATSRSSPASTGAAPAATPPRPKPGGWTLRWGRVGPEPVRKYQDPPADSTGGRRLPRARTGRILGTGELPVPRHTRPRAAQGDARPDPADPSSSSSSPSAPSSCCASSSIPGPLTSSSSLLVALVGLLAIREREAVADTEGTRRTEAEIVRPDPARALALRVARRDRRRDRRGAGGRARAPTTSPSCAGGPSRACSRPCSRRPGPGPRPRAPRCRSMRARRPRRGRRAGEPGRSPRRAVAG